GAHDEAWEILQQYRDALDAMVLELVEKETLTKVDLERILESVHKRPPHSTFSAFGKRTPSDRPPIDIPPSLRKPSPNGTHSAANNGSSNGNGANGSDGKAIPGVTPDATAPQPPSSRQSGYFGPSDGDSQPSQPYGGYPPLSGQSYDNPTGSGN
ncbi:MAG: cell division protein FtsH, partial [Jatrophihabitans sp.]